MGLLATLPRATNGHLGAANRALTRATHGWLQTGQLAPRRPGGGLFAPVLPESEQYRRIVSVLCIGIDGNSSFALVSDQDQHEKLTGRLWLNGASGIQTGREEPDVLRVVEAPPSLRVETADEDPQASEPTDARTDIPATPGPVGQTRIRGRAGLVLAAESRFNEIDPPATTYAELAGGTLWFGGGSRFTALDVGIDVTDKSDEELTLIIAMLQEMINGR